MMVAQRSLQEEFVGARLPILQLQTTKQKTAQEQAVLVVF